MLWPTYLSTLSALMALGVLIVMVLCVARREHFTVWTIWGSKYLGARAACSRFCRSKQWLEGTGELGRRVKMAACLYC
jgi:hypothetical protein